MISQRTIDQIFDAAQILDVVSDYVDLKRRGANYVGRCPFHDEKTPSFNVSPARNIYKCFGCGKAGNAVNFIMEHEHLSYVEALRLLARKYHITIEETGERPEQQQQRNDRESMLVLMGHAQKLFASTLFEHPDGRAVGLSYFKERGLREDTMQKFGLGYCLPQRDAFTQQMIRDGFKREFLVATGLSIENEQHLYDRFWGRVLFPIHDTRGQVVAFGGRVLTTDKTRKVAKYINSPESEIYHKSNHLYGIHQASRAIAKEDKCYLVEGYLDVLSMSQAGVENVVASSGTSLTTEQIKLISRFTSNVTVLYDGDAAGIKASLRGIDMILEAGLHVRIVPLPDGEDPDSMAQKLSSTDFKAYLTTHETDFIAFKTQLLLDEAKGDPLQRAQLIKDVVQSISVIPDGVTRMVYIQSSCRTLQISEQTLVAEVDKLRLRKEEEDFVRQRRKRAAAGMAETPPAEAEAEAATADEGMTNRILSQQLNEMEIAEREIVRLLMMYGNRTLRLPSGEEGDGQTVTCTVSQYILGIMRTDGLQLDHPLYRRIMEEVEGMLKRGETPSDNHFIRHASPEVASLAASFFSGKYTLSKIFNMAGRPDASAQYKEEDHLDSFVPMQVQSYKAFKVNDMLRHVLDEIGALQQDGQHDPARLTTLLESCNALNMLKKELAAELGGRVIR